MMEKQQSNRQSREEVVNQRAQAMYNQYQQNQVQLNEQHYRALLEQNMNNRKVNQIRA